MFKIIISSDIAIQQAQKVIFEKFVYGLTWWYIRYIFVIPYKIDITVQIVSFIIFFIANLSFSLQLSIIYFIGLSTNLNIILISCIVGQILAVNQVTPCKI